MVLAIIPLFLWDIFRLAVFGLAIFFSVAVYLIGYTEAISGLHIEFYYYWEGLESRIAPILSGVTTLLVFFLVLYAIMDCLYRCDLPRDQARSNKSLYPHFITAIIVFLLATLAKLMQQSSFEERISLASLVAAWWQFTSYAQRGFGSEIWIHIYLTLFWLLVLKMMHTTLLVIIIVLRACFRGCIRCLRGRRDHDDEGGDENSLRKSKREGKDQEGSYLPVIMEESEPHSIPPHPSPP